MTHLTNIFTRIAGILRSRYATFAVAMLVGIAPVQYSSAAVSQVPLYLGGGGVPGNLVLTPSVEYPTIQSLANLGDYSTSKRFEGYFDPGKCYQYDYKGHQSDENHFYPSSKTSNFTCSGSGEWSGNFLNWAVTQTIDPFRKVLTGGYRVKDTPTETWLEKARHPGQSGLINRVISGEDLVKGATPFDAHKVTVKIQGLNKDMRFSLGNNSVDSYEVQYDPANFPQSRIWVSGGHHGGYWQSEFAYRAAVRVKVCDPSAGLENNCREYDNGWKPEGVLQQNADRIRYSVFGYLNQDGSGRDGGVMRARQKYIGPERFVGGSGFEDNPNKEWNPDTGVLIDNPDPADATATPGNVVNSGVINYINKFGQLNNHNHKSNDPVSELYYAATRYLKNQGNVASYSSLSGSHIDKYTDGFPVISSWDDPIQFECQPNVILGIGDVNTHDDGNLPGSAYRGDEPSMPSEVSSDTTVNVTTMTNKLGDLEGISGLGNRQFTGRENTAYIAGLAYHNLTVDMRDDLAGKQTASTHWVDVLENEALLGPSQNQYYLAAKYGGFSVPDDFDPMTRSTALDEDWWHSNGETVSWKNTSFKRPDNFYIAGQADLMIESLQEAFRNISAELSSSSSSIAANSTSLENDTAVYQASFNSARWSGELVAYELQGTTISTTPFWQVSHILDAKTDSQMDSRTILTAQPMTENSGVFRTTTGSDFEWIDLTQAQKDALADDGAGGSVSPAVAQDRLDYLRGKRVNERTDDNQIRMFRQRDSRLGDIINSSPVYVHQENFGYFRLDSQTGYSGITSYADFRDSNTYKDRPPFLLVGANDGMLHAFDASVTAGGNGGEELFAYVPAGVMDDLWKLTDPNYSHSYYVDGTPVVIDAWLGGSLGWRTLAVGTTGAGGRSVFGLDVTDPENMDESNVLWEFSHTDMGLTMQTPGIAALANGKFGVAVSSGYDTALMNGKVWFLDASTGDVMREITIPTNGAELGSPVLIDLNADRIADRMYVADTAGKMWRVDVDSNTLSNWQAPSGLRQGNTMYPLFEAAAGQSITADLTAALNDNGEVMVFFGTGSFQNVGDNVVGNSPVTESFYGIIDRGEPVERSSLLEQEILDEVTQDGNRLRLVSKNTPSGTYNGWYMDLIWKASNGGVGAKGERVVSQAVVRSDRVIFPTLIPSEDPCEAGGRSWLMEVNLYSGGQLNYEVFDINNDGKIDGDDRIPGDDDDGNIDDPAEEPPSGIDPDIGIIQKPTIIEDCDDGNECKIVSGSSGQAEVILEKGIAPVGRINWEQLR